MKQTYSKQTKLIAGLLLFAAASLLLASWYVKSQQADYQSALMVTIAEQETRMTSLAELSDRDSVDSVVDKLVQDCDLKDRERFDTLLGSLSQLNRTELLEVDQLFQVCGGYYAERKAVLIARLQREFEVYQQYIKLLSLTSIDVTLYDTKVANWTELVSSEGKRGEYTTKLVEIQGKIIDELISGAAVNSEVITENLKEAQTAKDTLIYLDTSIDKLRSTLAGI